MRRSEGDEARQYGVKSKSPAVPAQRMGALRGFARHRAAFDDATEIPPRGLLAHPTVHKSPHIYSDAEVAALLGAASRHLYPRGGVRPLVYRTLFALLAATGLRISEARGLACRDVDLREGVLRVRAGKNGKERIVPLHPSAIEPLREYASRRDASPAVRRSDSFFRTERAPSLGRTDPAKTFARLRQALGWSAAGRARVPRIHDLRHTFAVRRLLRWCAEGVDVHRKIAALSTYLGHCKVSDTYWYACRWKIETFHKILKSGCKAESLRLRTAERLASVIAVFCILSWQAFWMSMVNRSDPTAPAALAFTETELSILDRLVPTPQSPIGGPRLSPYVVKLARLGGYLARSRDAPPGNTVLWRGMARLTDIKLEFTLRAEVMGN